MKTLLICPARRPAVALLAEELPLAALPILGESLVALWVEHVASLGARDIRIVASDRADAIRTCVGDGARWGVRIEIIAAAAEPTPAEALSRYRAGEESGWLPSPHDIVVLNHLPGRREYPLFDSYAAWFSAVLGWMPSALTPARVRVSELRPGIWIGRRAHVAKTARLFAPCWIGDQAFVGPDAVIGPGAVLEDRSVVERGARVVQSLVFPDTYVGRLTSVTQSLAAGARLTNWRTGSSLQVPDPFLMCSLVRAVRAPSRPTPRRPLLGWLRPGSLPAELLSRGTPGLSAVHRH